MKISPIVIKVNEGYTVRTEQLDGRAYLVAPVVILTEGVHCGSAGCKLYTAEELSGLPPAWNGRPLPVFHPEDEAGNALSANSPELIQSQSVGQLFNIEYVNGALKGEIWVDVQKAETISPETLAILRARKPLEVSTGLWSTDQNTPGEWNGERYDAIVKQIVPDHLALLPGGLGACSIDDGCGVRANSNKQGGEVKITLEANEMQTGKSHNDYTRQTRVIIGHANEISKKQITSIERIIDNELSHGQIRSNLQRAIDKLDNPMNVHYVIEIYDDYLIYESMSRSEGGETKLYKQTYSVKENEEVELGEEVEEVRQVVSFEKLNAKEVDTMADAKPCCPAKVQALIDNEASPYTEEHKALLLALNEEGLASLELAVNEEEDTAKKTIEALQAENEALKANSNKVVKFEDLLNTAPAGMKESIQNGMSMFAAQKAGIITQILANTNCEYTEAELNTMNFAGLTKLSKAFQIVPDYSFNGAPKQTVNDDKEEPLMINRGEKKE